MLAIESNRQCTENRGSLRRCPQERFAQCRQVFDLGSSVLTCGVCGDGLGCKMPADICVLEASTVLNARADSVKGFRAFICLIVSLASRRLLRSPAARLAAVRYTTWSERSVALHKLQTYDVARILKLRSSLRAQCVPSTRRLVFSMRGIRLHCAK